MPSSDLPSGAVGINRVELEQKLDNVIKSESPARKKTFALDDLFGEVCVTEVEPVKSLKSRVEHEIVNYKCESSMPLDFNPLFWWKVHQKHILCLEISLESI